MAQTVPAAPYYYMEAADGMPRRKAAGLTGEEQKERKMREISFTETEILFALLWLVSRSILWIRSRHIDWKREAALLLMYINLAVIIRFVFFPMARADGRVQPLAFDPAAVFPLRVNLVPLVNLFDYAGMRDLLLNVVGNAAMFIPTGILLPFLYRRLDTFRKVLAAGFGLSLCIEILQLPFPARASDADDLILNTLGVIAGYGIWRLIKRKRETGLPKRK